MIDAIGNKLRIGDEVVYSWPDAAALSPATVIGFTDKKVRISLDYGGNKIVSPLALCCYYRNPVSNIPTLHGT